MIKRENKETNGHYLPKCLKCSSRARSRTAESLQKRRDSLIYSPIANMFLQGIERLGGSYSDVGRLVHETHPYSRNDIFLVAFPVGISSAYAA